MTQIPANWATMTAAQQDEVIDALMVIETCTEDDALGLEMLIRIMELLTTH